MQKSKITMSNLKVLFAVFLIVTATSTFAQRASQPKVAPAICDATTFNYTATSAVAAVTFTWTRAAVVGIQQADAVGSNEKISEVLHNTTANPLWVKYVYTMVEPSGCLHVDYLFVSVNPTPMISSFPTAQICDSTAFIYTASTATNNTTYTWVRAAVVGIEQVASNGVGASINEVLSNSTAADITVTYVFTLTANGCSNNQTVAVTVHPTAFLALNYKNDTRKKVSPFFYNTSNSIFIEMGTDRI